MKTTLNNHILDILDFESIVILDLSEYNEDIEPSNCYFEVWPPNYSGQILYEYVPLTNTIVNSASLGWTDECLSPLPDGLWVIKQSVCPNEVINLTRYHLRIINSQALLSKEMVKAIEQADEKGLSKLYDQMKDLETAKYLAEICNEVEKAKALFNSVVINLNNCQTC